MVQARLRYPAGSRLGLWRNELLAREDYERQFRRLVLAQETLFKPIAQAMFQGLGCDPHIYDQKLTGTNFGLRLNYYPPMTEEQDRSGAGRLLGHEDVDMFTILPASRVDGLQVWNHPQRQVGAVARAGRFHNHQHRGLHAAISNDRLPSTTHRVGKSTNASHRTSARVSFPTNVYLWEDEVLDVLPGRGPPKCQPIQAITFHTRSTNTFYGDSYAVESA